MTRTPCTLALALTLAACADGGPYALPDAPRAPRASSPDACASEVPERAVGRYTGAIVLDATATGGPYCAWSTAIEITGRAIAGECALSARVLASVDQAVFPAPGTVGAAECRPVDAVLDLVPETARAGGDLVLAYQPAAAIERGPYAADPAALVPWLHPFGGISPLLDRLVIGYDGALDAVQTRPSVAYPIAGRLAREPR